MPRASISLKANQPCFAWARSRRRWYCYCCFRRVRPMLLSTSNFESSRVSLRPDGFTIAMLCTVVAILAMAEGVTVLGFDRTSKVQRREVAQRQALLTVRDSEATSSPHVAVLGNSLL